MKNFFFLIKFAVFIVSLPIIASIWIIELLLFLPIIFISIFFRKTPNISQEAKSINSYVYDKSILFNRFDDISKIYGCNTRNVEYRWNTFENYIKGFDNNTYALDFGAGSLRDSYELNKMNVKVDAVDFNYKALKTSFNYYKWDHPDKIELIDSTLIDHKSKNYDLVLAFDVIEHLIEPEKVLNEIISKLRKGGFIFVTVPNKRSLFERVWQLKRFVKPKIGLINDNSGREHVNFFTPKEWKLFFIKNKLSVLEHDMTIGFFVNDFWQGFYGLLSRVLLDPFLVNLNFKPRQIEKFFYPKWLMARINAIDEMTKKLFSAFWGWNIFVLSKK